MALALGEPHLWSSGVHARLGDPGMFPVAPEVIAEAGETLDDRIAHDPQAAVLTLAMRDLTDAVRELIVTLNRPPWYRRWWTRVVAFLRQES